jgi:hypothetical protein
MTPTNATNLRHIDIMQCPPSALVVGRGRLRITGGPRDDLGKQHSPKPRQDLTPDSSGP